MNPVNDESKTTGINEDAGSAEVPGARVVVDAGIVDSGNSATVVGTDVNDSVGRDTTEKFAVEERNTGGKEARKQEGDEARQRTTGNKEAQKGGAKAEDEITKRQKTKAASRKNALGGNTRKKLRQGTVK